MLQNTHDFFSLSCEESSHLRMVLLKAVKVFRTEVFDKCCVCASNETKFKIWLPGITEVVQSST